NDKIVIATLPFSVATNEGGTTAICEVGGVADSHGNTNTNTDSVVIDDGVGPQITRAVIGDGNVVVVTFTEHMDWNTVTTDDFVLDQFIEPAVNGKPESVQVHSATTIQLQLASPIGTDSTGRVRLSSKSVVSDMASNANTNTDWTTVQDGRGPIVTDAVLVQSKVVRVTFSEPSQLVNIPNFAITIAGVPATVQSVVIEGLSTVGVITLADSFATDSTGVLTVNAAAVKDVHDNNNVKQENVIVRDGTGPTLMSARSISRTQLEITLSESVVDLPVQPSAFTLTGFASSPSIETMQFGAGLTTIRLTLASSIGTDEVGTISVMANAFKDNVGNANDADSVTSTDGVGPEIV
ncbi:MAG: hypothetical protein VXX80_10895, partial [Bacteroidota bacterium]|nr:hypothetical protein [Bacteroidota bacterium]